jgi:hypothetical protein
MYSISARAALISDITGEESDKPQPLQAIFVSHLQHVLARNGKIYQLIVPLLYVFAP